MYCYIMFKFSSACFESKAWYIRWFLAKSAAIDILKCDKNDQLVGLDTCLHHE